MEGRINRAADIEIRWNAQAEKLYSPDGTRHLLPCERCGQPQWAAPPVVSVLCDRCAAVLADDLADFGPAVAAGEISEADAIMAVARERYPRPW